MAKSNRNNDDLAPPGSPAADDVGEAAMLLVESLIHGLIARSLITVQDAVQIIDSAVDVREEIAFDREEKPASVARSITLLKSILKSLASDIEGRLVQSD